ncbi:MAG: F0F1 ATP synthase subunit alpha, partial [Ilumatobacteraceae bacterium]
RLKLDLSQYRELEAFSQFGSELDPETQRTLARGERLVKTLNQGERQPMPVEEQVVVVFAGTKGYLDSIPVDDVRRFEGELLEHMRSTQGGLLSAMRDAKADVPAELTDVIAEFKERFVAADAAARAADPTATDAHPLGAAESQKTLATE